jgi:hypothetical protein
MKKYIFKSIVQLIFPALMIFITSVCTVQASSLLFAPLKAYIFEPRIGTFYQFKEEKLRLDIGTTVELLKFDSDSANIIHVGCDFFTYTRLRTAGNFKFPVETSDYYFGVNASAKHILFGREFYFRGRVAHISSHLVDGMARDSVFSRQPYVYSREFIDYAVATVFAPVRIYAGITYLFHKIPDDASAFIPQLGFDFEQKLTGDLFVSGGYDFRLVGIDGISSGSNSAELGLFYKANASGAGVFAGGFFYSGKSIHGMFYRENDEYSGIGFRIEF